MDKIRMMVDYANSYLNGELTEHEYQNSTALLLISITDKQEVAAIASTLSNNLRLTQKLAGSRR